MKRSTGRSARFVALAALVPLLTLAATPSDATASGASVAASSSVAASGGTWAPPLHPPAASSIVHRRSWGDEQALGVAAGPGGEIVVTGTFKDPGVLAGGGTELPLPWAPGSRYDLFVAKYDASSTLQWVVTATGSGDDKGTDVSVDAVGNVFVGVSTTSASMTFAGGGASVPTGHHVMKLTSAGALAWIVPLGKGDPQVVGDGAGGVFASGVFTGSTTFGSGPAAQLRISAGSTDVYVARLDAAGALQWVARGGGAGADVAADIDLAADGGPLVAATVVGPASFRAGVGVATTAVPSFGGEDAALIHWSATGALGWATALGGPGADRAGGLDARPDGSSRLVGRFEATAAVGTGSITSAGAGDGFVVDVGSGGVIGWGARSGGAGEERLVSVTAGSTGAPVVLGTITGDGTITGPGGVTQAVLNNRLVDGPATTFLAGFAGTEPSWVSAVHSRSTLPAGGPLLRHIVSVPGGDLVVGGTVTGVLDAVFGEGVHAPTVQAGWGDVVLAHYPEPAAAPAVAAPVCAQVAWVGAAGDNGPADDRRLWVGDPAGTIAPLPGAIPTSEAGPWWTPDGARLVWLQNPVSAGGPFTLMIADADGSGAATSLGAVHPDALVANWAPAFSADGSRVAWTARYLPGVFALYVAPTNGAAPAAVLSWADPGPPTFAGASILFIRTLSGVGRVFSIPAGGGAATTVSLPTEPAQAALGIDDLDALPFLVWGTSSAIRYVLPTIPEMRISSGYAANDARRVLSHPLDHLLSWNEGDPGSGASQVRIETWPVGSWSPYDFHGYAALPPGGTGIVGQEWHPDGTELLFTEPTGSTAYDAGFQGLGHGNHLSATRYVPWDPFTLRAGSGARWSPDGQHVAFLGEHGAFVIDRAGVRGARRIGPGESAGSPPAWSPLSGGADLGATLVSVPAAPSVGQPFTVTLTVRNGGLCPSTGSLVKVVSLAGNVRLTGGSLSQGVLTGDGWQVGPLAVGATATLQFELVADASTVLDARLSVDGVERDPWSVNGVGTITVGIP